MKLVTLRNGFHGTETKVNVPETITNTMDVIDWLWREGESEKRIKGHYALKRKRYLEHVRKLCNAKNCNCGLVKDEEC